MQRVRQSLRPSNPRLHSEMFGTETIPNRPTGKLMLAALGMCLVMMNLLFKEAERGVPWNTCFFAGACGFGIWLSFFGVFRSHRLHRLWGFLCLLAGTLMICVWFATSLFGMQIVSAVTNSELLRMLVICSGVLITGYLLVIDREVKAYRHQLKTRDDERHRLQPIRD